jgi:hypothetical protein
MRTEENYLRLKQNLREGGRREIRIVDMVKSFIYEDLLFAEY